MGSTNRIENPSRISIIKRSELEVREGKVVFIKGDLLVPMASLDNAGRRFPKRWGRIALYI